MKQVRLITDGLKIVKSTKSGGHNHSPNPSSKFKNSKENKTKYTNGKENGTQNKVNRHSDGEENGMQNKVNRHRDGEENGTQNKVNRHRDGEENRTQNSYTERDVTKVQNTRRGIDIKEKCLEMVRDLIDNKVSLTYLILT
jgi:hypothetical protein